MDIDSPIKCKTISYTNNNLVYRFQNVFIFFKHICIFIKLGLFFIQGLV